MAARNQQEVIKLCFNLLWFKVPSLPQIGLGPNMYLANKKQHGDI
jgi:hypothetical protein